MIKLFAKTKGKDRGEIYVYEAIGEGWFGGITAKSFSDTMKELGSVKALDIFINSPGGSVFDGIAIYNMIVRHSASEKVVHVDGIAASIASVIAMAGTEIRIAENGMVMIHDPWGMSVGTADEMRKSADSLDKVRDTLLDTYVSRTKGKREEISKWMTEETWMNADEAIARGFATTKTEGATAAALAQDASFALLAKFTKTPAALKQKAKAPNVALAHMDMRIGQLSRRKNGAAA